MLSFQEESWHEFLPDALPLWERHYEELCQDKVHMPMGPDLETYGALEAIGILQLVTARDPNGALAGYQISIIRPHLHYCSVLCQFEDTYFLDKPYRKGLAGVKLIQFSLVSAKAKGVKRSFFQSIESKPTDKLWQWLGFKKTHVTYSKWIGG